MRGCNRLIHRQRLLEVLHGGFVLPVQKGHRSQVVQRGRELRIVLQRPPKFLVRIPPIAQFELGNAQLVI